MKHLSSVLLFILFCHITYFCYIWISKFEPYDILPPETDLDDLIIVPGHAIYLKQGFPTSESDWILESFQKGQTEYFINHIREGIKLLESTKSSLLIFSGGQTRKNSPLSEAQSYWNIAYYSNWLRGLTQRVAVEGYARDSLENVVYSVCRFYQVTGKMPNHIYIVGFGFKMKRFVDLHRQAIEYPVSRFTYISADDVQINDTAYSEFENDIFGCSPNLQAKRTNRNPFKHKPGYQITCPNLNSLFQCQ